MKHILVTGGAGFIGSHICNLLLENNYQLTILDSFINSSSKSIDKIKELGLKKNKNYSNNLKIIKADLRNYEKVHSIFNEAYSNNNLFEGVIHLAGLKSTAESVDKPLLYWDSNLVGSINLFKIMDIFNCYKIIFSSSASIYGLKEDNPLKEETNIFPINPYGNTKFVIEKLL